MKILIPFLILFLWNCKPKEQVPKASEVKLLSITATSELKDPNSRYASFHLTDQTFKSWCEGSPQEGIGEKLTIKLEKKALIEQFTIFNGFGEPNYFKPNGRVKEFKVFVDSVEVGVVAIADTMDKQLIHLPKPTEGTEIVLEILSIYPGTMKDTCIQEISLSDLKITPFPKFEFCNVKFTELDFTFERASGTIDKNKKITFRGMASGHRCEEPGEANWVSQDSGKDFSLTFPFSISRNEFCGDGGSGGTISVNLTKCDANGEGTSTFSETISGGYSDENFDLNCTHKLETGKLTLACEKVEQN